MSVDSRIVEMKFDNAEFERNAKTSMDTLKKLDENLQMENGARGFAKIAEAASNVSFAPLAAGIEEVSGKFSAMEIAAITVISNITNSVMNAAKNIANSLFIEPITTGLNEYEQKMDNVQTTMINSGQSLETVNDTLDELNHYADKTIFKFSDMTTALSKFTMSGITDLNLASTMVEGIGNIAGESGLKTEQASSAFYMISQAMASGKMALYQWRTLETTGFASSKFRENLLETAVALGKLKKNADGTYATLDGDHGSFDAGSMRDTLTKSGWFDKELMETIFARYASAEASTALGFEDISESAFHAAQDIKTFSQMFDTLEEAAQSGWAETWQLVIGDYEQAKKLWTNVNEVLSGILDSHSKARNDFLKTFNELGGRKVIIETFGALWDNISGSIEAVRKGIANVFPPMSAKKLYDSIVKIYDATTDILWGVEQANKARIVYVVQSIAGSLKSLLDSVKKVFVAIQTGFRGVFPKGKTLADWFGKNAIIIKNFFDDLSKKLTVNSDALNKIWKTARGFFSIFDIAIEFAKSLYKFLSPLFEKFFPKIGKLGNGVLNLSSGLGEGLYQLRNWIKENNAFDKMFEGIANAFTNVKGVLSKFISFISDKFGPAWQNFKDSLTNLFNDENNQRVNIFVKLWEGVKAVFEGIGKLLSSIAPVFKTVGILFGTILGKIAEGVTALMGQASGGGIVGVLNSLILGFGSLAGLQFGWKVFDGIGDIVSAGLAAIKGFAGTFKDFIDSIVGGIGELKDAEVFNLRVDALKKVAIAVALMAASIFLLAQADPKKVAANLGTLAGAIIELIGALYGVNKIGSIFSKDGGFGDIRKMSTLSTSLIKVAASVLIMSISLSMLAKLDTGKVYAAVGALALTIAVLVGALYLLPTDTKGLKSSSKAIEGLAASLLILSVALKIMSTIPFSTLMGSILGMVILMAAIDIFVNTLPKDAGGKMALLGLGLVGLATAMLILSGAMLIMSLLNPESLFVTVVAIGALIGFFAIVANAVKDSAGAFVAFSAGMLVLSTALLILSGVMLIISTMEISSLITSVLGIGVIVGIFVIAASAISNNIAAFIGFSAGMLILSAAILVLAGAMKILETVDFSKALPSVIAIGVIMALLAVLSLIVQPLQIIALSASMLIFSAAILVLAAALSMLTAIPTGKMAASLGIIIGFFAIFILLGAVVTLMPPLLVGLTALMAIFMGFAVAIGLVGAGILALSAGMAALAVTGTAGTAVLVYLITSLVGLLPFVVTMVMESIVAIIQGIADMVPPILDIVQNLIVGILDILIAVVPKFCEYLVVLVTSLLDTLIALVPVVHKKLMIFWMTVYDTIKKDIDMVWPYIKQTAKGIGEKMSGWFSKLKEIAGNIWQGFIDGMKAAIDAVVETAKNIANKVVSCVKDIFDIHSPSHVFYDFGKMNDIGLANGMKENMGIVSHAATKLGDTTLTMLKDAMSGVGALLENDEDFNPTITPVLDLSNVQAGTKSLASLLSNQNGGKLTAELGGRLSKISGNVSKIAGNSTVVNNNYDLTQNNYSPKALSRIELYRQTENQFSRLKGAISGA